MADFWDQFDNSPDHFGTPANVARQNDPAYQAEWISRNLGIPLEEATRRLAEMPASDPNLAQSVSQPSGEPTRTTQPVGDPITRDSAPNNSPYGGLTGAALANDPAYIDSQINLGFQQRYGRPPTEQELAQWRGYATNPDTYSDGTVHKGWNPYLMDRLVTPGHEGSSDPRLAGTDTIVGRTSTLGGVGGGQTTSGGALPPGYSMGSFTGGGMYPLASVNAPGLMQPWTTPFKAPTGVTMENDPGYKARLGMGLDALQGSAAARGTLLTGGLMKDMNEYAQGFASNEYDKIYGRALGEYNTAYGIYDRNQANQFNRLSSVANTGMNAANQTGGYGSEYGRRAGDLDADAGNINAGETAGKNNNNQSWLGDVADFGTEIVSSYLNGRNKKPTTGQPAV